MTDEELQALEDCLAKLPPVRPRPEPNFFDVGGAGYLENPTSDLMALFMGAEPTVPPWLAKALLGCLIDKGYAKDLDVKDIAWENVTAEREVSEQDGETDTYKRLDLLISSDQFVLGVENKVYASAAGNPFGIYDQLLENRASGVGCSKTRCILRPTNRIDDLSAECDWPVITYPDLVDKAQSFYGEDIALQPVTKWSALYAEFLKHLESLATPGESQMNTTELEFVASHFKDLRRAGELLKSFEEDLQEEAQKKIAKVLADVDVDTNIKPRINTWGEEKALLFFPQSWGGKSHIVLVYNLDEDESNPESQVGYYFMAYIHRDGVQLDKLASQFEKAALSGKMSWIYKEADSSGFPCTWYKSNNDLLACYAWAPQWTSRKDSLHALGDLTQWMQKHVYG